MDVKHCNKCHETKSLTEFYFRKDKNIYKSDCKLCQKKNKAIYDCKGLDYYDRNDDDNFKCPQCPIPAKKNLKKSKEQIILDRQKRFPSLIPTGIIKNCVKCKSDKDESEFPVVYGQGFPERSTHCKICSNRKKI